MSEEAGMPSGRPSLSLDPVVAKRMRKIMDEAFAELEHVRATQDESTMLGTTMNVMGLLGSIIKEIIASADQSSIPKAGG